MRTTSRTARPSRALRAAFIAAAVALLSGCAHVAPRLAAAPAPHDTVTIDALHHAPYVGTSPVISARIVRGDGRVEQPLHVFWTSRTLDRGWVADDGTLTVLKSGRLTVAAEAIGIGTARSFEARGNPVERVAFGTHLRAGVHPGDAIRIEAAAFRGDGSPVEDALITYAVESRGGAVQAEVAPDGVFSANAAGVYTVVAECGGHADQVVIVVREAPVVAVVAPVVAAVESRGRPMRMATFVTRAPATTKLRISDGGFEPYVNTALTLQARVWVGDAHEPDSLAMPLWTTSDSSIAWVSGEGVVVFRGPGRVTISAQHGGKRAARSFLVREHPAAHMVLNTNAADVRPGQAVKFREQVWQRGGTPVRDARVNYAIVGRGDAVRGATISDDRIFVATQPGVYTVIATIGGLADKVTIVVRPSQMALRGE